MAAPRLWFDVEDLFEYARANPRPSGIQRVAFELYRTFQEQYGASGFVHFVRHDPGRNSFRSVPWSEVATVFAGLAAGEPPPARRAQAIRPRSAPTRLVRRLVHRLPSPVRASIIDAGRAQTAALQAGVRAVAALVREVRYATKTSAIRHGHSGSIRNDYIDLAKVGDLLLALGAPWSHPDYAGLIRAQRKQRGLRFVLLVYDLIPARHPEWCDRGLVRLFRAWCDSALPLCDAIFAISRATAADVMAYAAERGLALPPVVPLPMGTGFGNAPPLAEHTERLPPPGSYALYVSTIEARKNHLLLFRIWQRLLVELYDTEVPTLVFAGRVGWLVEDLMHQIANTDYLNGRLVLIENPTDGELAALYQGCLFTLLPSFYEGWGLSVSESLAFGKPCLIADRTSLPEAGGGLARRFDPDNLPDAYVAVRNVIQDRANLARWEAQVRKEFRPVPWSATVAALLAGVGNPVIGECLREPLDDRDSVVASAV
jgi:glycosyltransferase involved in cell wall biosynthesis